MIVVYPFIFSYQERTMEGKGRKGKKKRKGSAKQKPEVDQPQPQEEKVQLYTQAKLQVNEDEGTEVKEEVHTEEKAEAKEQEEQKKEEPAPEVEPKAEVKPEEEPTKIQPHEEVEKQKEPISAEAEEAPKPAGEPAKEPVKAPAPQAEPEKKEEPMVESHEKPEEKAPEPQKKEEPMVEPHEKPEEKAPEPEKKRDEDIVPKGAVPLPETKAMLAEKAHPPPPEENLAPHREEVKAMGEPRSQIVQEKSPGGTLKRRDSKFELQKGAVMYRPEFIYEKSESQKDIKMWELMKSYLGWDIRSIQRQIVNHVEYTLARTRFNFEDNACYYATAYSVRDRLVESWNDTHQHLYEKDPKCVYYMSMEYLLGRMLQNALVNTGHESHYKDALEDLGFTMEEVYEEENDPGLGNGGLGRLAACFLDSLTTLEYPAWGYGIRYNYGIFKQEIRGGYQVEFPDYWLARGNPWEIERLDVTVPVMFYGSVKKYKENGVERNVWEGGETVQALAYDTPIPGYNTFNTNNLRLWRACPSAEFDFKSFNTGDYFGAVKAKQKAESISSVLYPNDTTIEGKELRLKQEYFFCAATLDDIIKRYLKKHDSWNEFPDKVSIQLNDTHPALSIIEMIRILVDQHRLPWDQAWKITCLTFSYTNHTVMMEALEKWDVDLLQRLLPRHMELIFLINHFFLESVRKVFKGDDSKVRSLSLIEEGEKKKVRMANICIVASHKVNGVAALHTDLIRNWLFRDFVEYYNRLDKKYHDKFINVTNGVTPRRWLLCTNPKLAELITDKLGHEEWVTDLSGIRDLKAFSRDEDVIDRLAQIKRENKVRLAAWVMKNCNGLAINPDAMFDVFVKRIHEYKRQLMAALYIVHRYLWIKEMRPEERSKVVPRVFLIGGKAAPGYDAAKKTIKLINAIGDVINHDKDIGDLLKVVYLPNYSVSNAQVIVPAADISQHISTAGTEASGTSNMKFAMNGCLIIGTMDGANVEIAEEIGKENMFIFGANVEQVNNYRKMMFEGKRDYVPHTLWKVINALLSGRFGNLNEMHDMLKRLTEGNDFYVVCWDFQAYLDCQERVDECYKNQKEWLSKAVVSIACSGKFSTDRTIKEYAEKIWQSFKYKTHLIGALSRCRYQNRPIMH
eukprot:TRINITY_DN91_c0_g3_i1.p2 TRINITY_DN91_c0_g3~~TRINITY_DN91_c0_g3_i1.p2  ORF type:complete len:1131 (-),score=200.71 TRINITY_DN91_c0_g3_i1:5812-9204(-)